MEITKVGITERGDAGLSFAWVKKLEQANIIISKNLNDKLIKHLVENQDKIIFHMTCTGLGGTPLEPNVPSAVDTYHQFRKLIEAGFPSRQVVLRVDPIISENHLEYVDCLLDLYQGQISRVRFSFLDIYPHVAERFKSAGMPLPWNGFAPPQSLIDKTLRLFSQYDYDFESCAETNQYQLGCISQKDLNILGHTIKVQGKCPQRKECQCLNMKHELLTYKRQCKHQCLYCYWK